MLKGNLKKNLSFSFQGTKKYPAIIKSFVILNLFVNIVEQVGQKFYQIHQVGDFKNQDACPLCPEKCAEQIVQNY